MFSPCVGKVIGYIDRSQEYRVAQVWSKFCDTLLYSTEWTGSGTPKTHKIKKLYTVFSRPQTS